MTPISINSTQPTFRPSPLSFPPSPSSPLSPLEDPTSQPARSPTPFLLQKSARSSPDPGSDPKIQRKPPPPNPLPWLWQCHICYRTYPLGATRRCLDDGHYFCAGECPTRTVRGDRLSGQAARRAKKTRACASEFDYNGWKAWGKWRREEVGVNSKHGKFSGLLGCAIGCDYPSECRWSKGPQHRDQCCSGVPTIEKGDAASDAKDSDVTMQDADSDDNVDKDTIGVALDRVSANPLPAMSFEEILGLTNNESIYNEDGYGEPSSPETVLSPNEGNRLHDFWASLFDSVKAEQERSRKRRKSDDSMRTGDACNVESFKTREKARGQTRSLVIL